MPLVRALPTSELSASSLRRLRRLLDASFSEGFSDADWLHTLGGWHVLVAEEESRIVGHAAVVPRRLEIGGQSFAAGYVEAVATLPERRRRGLGSRVMAEAAAVLHREFEVGALSTGRHRFYERLGWERWRGPTYVRQGPNLVRTADEDEGIMVLRFGVSAHVLAGEAIVCEARTGDDW